MGARGVYIYYIHLLIIFTSCNLARFYVHFLYLFIVFWRKILRLSKFVQIAFWTTALFKIWKLCAPSWPLNSSPPSPNPCSGMKEITMLTCAIQVRPKKQLESPGWIEPRSTSMQVRHATTTPWSRLSRCKHRQSVFLNYATAWLYFFCFVKIPTVASRTNITFYSFCIFSFFFSCV